VPLSFGVLPHVTENGLHDAQRDFHGFGGGFHPRTVWQCVDLAFATGCFPCALLDAVD